MKRIRVYRYPVLGKNLEKAKEYFEKMEERRKACLLEIEDEKHYYVMIYSCEIDDLNNIVKGLEKYILKDKA